MKYVLHSCLLQIRIFTYVMGRETNNYIEAVEQIACNNAGFYHQIESKNDAAEKVFVSRGQILI